MSFSRQEKLSNPLHALNKFSNSMMNDACSHLPIASHPETQLSQNRPNITKIVLPIHSQFKRSFKNGSFPKSSNVKRLRLVLKAESDQRESTIDYDTRRRPHARIRIRKSLAEKSIRDRDSIQNLDKVGTKETAHIMVKWALQNTPYLVANFEIRDCKTIQSNHNSTWLGWMRSCFGRHPIF
jgi:hypothetical protein